MIDYALDLIGIYLFKSFALMSEPSAVNTSAFGEFAEAAYCFAVLDFEHYSLTKAKVLCQIF